MPRPTRQSPCDDARVNLDLTSTSDKAEWRAQLLRSRRERSSAERATARASITSHLHQCLPELMGSTAAAPTICAYMPLASEPLPSDFPLLLAARGYRVLVPIATPGEPLDWCALPSTSSGSDRVNERCRESTYDDDVVPSRFGILEPTGPRLGRGAIRDASVILVPALATDRSGYRLGRGGGFYDRSLALIDNPEKTSNAGPGAGGDPVIPGIWRVAILFDGEADLPIPHDRHDARVTHVVTPSGGLRAVQ